jgi:hypothetical protein
MQEAQSYIEYALEKFPDSEILLYVRDSIAPESTQSPS